MSTSQKSTSTKKIKKEVDKMQGWGCQMAVIWYDVEEMFSYGHVAITSFNQANQAAIEDHPRFQFEPPAAPGTIKLPDPPVFNHRYTREDARACINKVLPLVLGARPGYGKPNLRPTWWTHKWTNGVNGLGWSGPNMFQLIRSLYAHYGVTIEPHPLEDVDNPPQSVEDDTQDTEDPGETMDHDDVPVVGEPTTTLPDNIDVPEVEPTTPS